MKYGLTVASLLVMGFAFAGGLKAEAATITTSVGALPQSKSYATTEKVGYWRRCYRRGYCGYGGGYPSYGYGGGYPYYGSYGYHQPYPYYDYGYGYRPYGYYGGWGPRIGIGIGPRWGWG